MQDKRGILEVLRRNEAIRRKFFEIESEILTVLKFEDLFARLVSLIKAKFDIPHVWITILREGDLSCMLDGLDETEKLSSQLVIAERDAVLPLLEGRTEPVLVSGELDAFLPLFPSPAPKALRSIAVAPLTLDGRLIGSLNQADTDPERFHPEMDSTLLAQLAVKVSLCLSNVTAHERLARLASCDPLTGLLNRRALDERLDTEFMRANRYGSVLSVAFVDMDDFKDVNDTLGHDAGDAMLRFFAKRLQKMARKIDSCARFAGDEFVVILPNTDRDQTQAFMTRVSKYFEFTPVPGLDRYVRFSVGVASTEDGLMASPAVLLKRADEELFEHKARKQDRSSTKPPLAVGED